MSFGAFAFIYFSLAFILFVLILFEKKFIELEDKYKKARKAKIRDLEKVIAARDKLIDLQHSNIRKLSKELSHQKKINSINLETLRQERLMRAKEKDNGTVCR